MCNCKKNDQTIIEALQDVMHEEKYISEESIKKISKKLNVSEAEIYGVATFYSQFSLEKSAKYTINVCTGTTCFVLGAESILNTLCKQLNVEPNKLSKDGKWYISTTRCLGCCGLAPVMTINGKTYGNLKPTDIATILKEYD